MNTKLGFMIWGDNEPVYVVRGGTNSFVDGNNISLIHDTEGFDFENDVFGLKMDIEGYETVSHEFKMENFRGKNIWLIADPSLTDINGSFSEKFVNQIVSLPEGGFKINLSFLVNGKILNEGFLTFNSTGQHTKYNELIPKLMNAESVRASAIEDYQQEFEQEREANEAAANAKNYFSIVVKNRNFYESTYILETNKRTLSENIHQIQPDDSLKIELFRGEQFELSVFGQDESKDLARPLSYVDESMHESTLIV